VDGGIYVEQAVQLTAFGETACKLIDRLAARTSASTASEHCKYAERYCRDGGGSVSDFLSANSNGKHVTNFPATI